MKESPAAPGQTSLHAFTAHPQPPETRVSQLSVSFGERVPVELLRSTWSAIAARHGVLRSSFRPYKNGELLRTEREAAEAPWRELDWSDIPPTELPSRWAATLAEECARPLDLSVAPVLRFVAIRLPGGATHMLVTHPRFLLDEEAWFFLLCEWIEALEGQLPPATEGEDAQTPLPTPLGDWWQTYLSDAKGTAVIYHPNPEPQNPVPDHAVLIDRDTTRVLATACQSKGLPLGSTLIALWGYLLARLSLQSEALVLTAHEIGGHLNVLPCRIPAPITGTISEWLQSFVSAEKQRTAHSAVPLPALPLPTLTPEAFASLATWLPPALNDRIPEAFPRWINLDARIIQAPLHPLELELRDGPRLHFRLRAKNFPPTEAGRLLSRFESLVRAFASHPDGPVSVLEVPDSTPAEKLSPEPPTAPAPIQDIIADTAQACPESIAIEDATGAVLAYREVHDYGLLVAAYLGNENLGQGWTIAVCLTPSPWLPVAVLGILHAGDTCLPLDPSAGSAWLSAQLEAGDAELVVCDSGTESFFANTGKKLLVIDREWQTIAATPLPTEPVESPKVAVHIPGTPKSDPPPLRALSPALLSLATGRSTKFLDLRPGDRLLLTEAAGTPAFLETLLCALRSGATLVIPQDLRTESLLAANPTHLRLTAQHFPVFVKALTQELPASLRCVTVEARPAPLRLEDVQAWQTLQPTATRTLQFVSPCGFCGLGLTLEITKEEEPPSAQGFLSLGSPTRLTGVTFGDLSGRVPPAGYPGFLRFKPPFHPAETGELAVWRDLRGNHFLTEIPTPPAIEEATPEPEPELPVVPAVQQHEDLEDVTEIPPAPESPSEPAPEFPTASATKPPAAFATLGGHPENPILILLHGMDGSTASYANLLPSLTTDWQVFGTFAPARDPRDVVSEATRIAAAILESWPGTPVHLLGIGYGGLTAFEVTTRLRTAGVDVPFLVIAATPAPGPVKGGWLGAIKRGLASVNPGQSENRASLTDLAAAYRPKPLQGPCGIILTTDLLADSELRWLELAPDAACELVAATADEILTSKTADFHRALGFLAGTSDSNPG